MSEPTPPPAAESGGAERLCSLKTTLVTVFSMSLALAISLVVVYTVKNIHRPKFQGEFQAAHLFSWQRQRSGFIYTCTSEHCLQEGEQLQKHIAWTLDPCDDFYDYVCSSTKPASSVRKSAVKHFLREVHDVIKKYSKLGWLKRTKLTTKVTSFYKTCKTGLHVSFRESAEKALSLLKLGTHGSTAEEGLAMLAKALQLFPLVHVSITNKARSQADCIVLKRPRGFDGDHIFDIPHAFSKSFISFVRTLLGSEEAAENAREIEVFLKRFPGLWSESFQKLSEYDPTTVQELKSNAWDWYKFLGGLVDSVRTDQCVVIRSPDYFKYLVKMLAKFTPSQVMDYLRYKAMLHLLPFKKLEEANPVASYENSSREICTLLTYRLYSYIFVKHFNTTVRLDVITSAGMKEAILRNSYR